MVRSLDLLPLQGETVYGIVPRVYPGKPIFIASCPEAEGAPNGLCCLLWARSIWVNSRLVEVNRTRQKCILENS